MSGIAGIIHFDGSGVEPGLIEKMTAAMPYRGPDGINHWVKGSVALGQCMLRTTPESLEETQPLTNEDESLVLVIDGRVDNWEELRHTLLGKGALLRTRSDAELVLRAYETWGQDCILHIDGDFALVIWDTQRRAAFCARDRVGNKPFNYSWDGKTFVFASELHPILGLPGAREVFNEGMLAEYLGNEWHSHEETFCKGVMRLRAAHRMMVDIGGTKKIDIGGRTSGSSYRAKMMKNMPNTTENCLPMSFGECRAPTDPWHLKSAGGLIRRHFLQWPHTYEGASSFPHRGSKAMRWIFMMTGMQMNSIIAVR